MPSPFPGMDPFLEAPDIWSDFHDAFAGEIRAVLNRTLPPRFYARLEMRPEVGILADDRSSRRIVPDVAVVHAGSSSSTTAVAEIPRTEISPSIEIQVQSESIRHAFVEIRDAARGHRLVTLIEIVSPSNKAPGLDRRAYLQKQREVLDCDASLVEIDLLRGGERLLAHADLIQFVAGMTPPPDYLVLVNRWWLRVGAALAYQAFPIPLRQPLPCVSVPLRHDLPDVPLDLQFVFDRVYDGGPYRRGAINYADQPVPPLSEADAVWAAERIRTHE